MGKTGREWREKYAQWQRRRDAKRGYNPNKQKPQHNKNRKAA